MAALCAQYSPSDQDTRRFWDRELQRGRPNVEVPAGFPRRLESKLAWKGTDIEGNHADWKLDLTEDEISAIDAALAGFEAKHEDLSSISASTFVLPLPFSQRLKKLSDQLYKGVGFQIIHGLDPTRYDPKQRITVYAGITAHVCPQRGFVDVFGKGVVAHVINAQAGNKGPETTAPAFSDGPLSFHTDNCEIMAFYYLDTALTGGRTILSSSWQTYNELALSRPDVLHTLTEPCTLDTFKPHSLQPPRRVRLLQKLNNDKVPVLFRFSRYPFTGFQRARSPGVPPPTQAQLEAADAIQFFAMKNAITLPVVKGDMLLVNDMALFHAREAFDDGGVPLKRHLIKMYFRDPAQGWAIPPSADREWGRAYGPKTQEEEWKVLYETGLEELSMLNG